MVAAGFQIANANLECPLFMVISLGSIAPFITTAFEKVYEFVLGTFIRFGFHCLALHEANYTP